MEVSELEGGPESHGEQWGQGKLEVQTSPCRSDEAFPPGPQDPPILMEPVAAISHGKGLQVTGHLPVPSHRCLCVTPGLLQEGKSLLQCEFGILARIFLNLPASWLAQGKREALFKMGSFTVPPLPRMTTHTRK